MLSHLTGSCSPLLLLLGFMLSPTAQPLHRFGPYCLGSAIEYSIRSVCWSSKLPCVKSIPLAPGGVVISLKMKLLLVSSPYSSTWLFSGRLGPCSCEALWWKPIRQILEECSGGAVIPGCQSAPQSHINVSVMLAWRSHWIILFPCFGINAVEADCTVPYARKISSGFRENALLDLLITSVIASQPMWG